MLMLNLLLMLAWVALTGSYAFLNMLFGFLLGYFVLWWIHGGVRRHSYFVRVPKLLGLFFYFIQELIKSNLRVTLDVLTPNFRMRPGIVAIPLDVKSDAEITVLANMITLTPGTLSLDVSNDRKVLYVHSMYMGEVQQARNNIKQGFERRIREIAEG